MIYVNECSTYSLFQEIYVFWSYIQSLIHLEFYFVIEFKFVNDVRNVLISFYMQLSSFPSFSCIEETLLLYNISLPPLSQINWPQVYRFISGLCSIPLICVSVFVPVPCYSHDCSFVVQFEARECDYPALFCLFFPLKIALASQDLLWFCINFRISYTFVKNVMGILIRIALGLQIALGSMVILTILVLLVHIHGISFPFFVYIFSFLHQHFIIFIVYVFHFLI